VLTRVAAAAPTVTKAWADGGYNNAVVEHGAAPGIDVEVEVVRRDPTVEGFKVLPRRRIVERTFGWFTLHRRLTRDYETPPLSFTGDDPMVDNRHHEQNPDGTCHDQPAGHLSHKHLNGQNAKRYPLTGRLSITCHYVTGVPGEDYVRYARYAFNSSSWVDRDRVRFVWTATPDSV
jgi:transposase